MLNPGNNILNLLLGIPASNDAAPQPGQPSINGGGEGFAAIFDLLLTPKMENPGSAFDFNLPLTNPPVEYSDFQKNDLSALAGNQKQSTATADELWGSIIPADKNQAIDLADFVEYVAADSESNTQKNVQHRTSSESVIAMLPSQGPITNARLTEILGTRPVDLPTGTFTVLDAKVDDGNVVLDLQPKDQAGVTIRLSLPAQKFQELFGLSGAAKSHLVMPGMDRVQRVNVEPGTLTEARRIEELALKLNLKEIEISDVSKAAKSPTVEDNSAKVVTVKIVAENAGQELVIKANLLRNELSATTPNRFVPDNPAADASVDNRQLTSKPDPAEAVVKQAMQNHSPANGFAAEQFKWEERMLRSFDKSDLINADQAKATPDVQHMLDNGRVQGEKISLQPVRFSLPENLSAALRPNGRTVMIRVEPESLGPARLHLSMHGDMLTARVTVENVHARAAIEGSLDQLTGQLARAGIKVHHVEVNVAGSDVGGQFFERRPEWNRPIHNQHIVNDTELERDAISPSVMASYRSSSYVGADGVNVFA